MSSLFVLLLATDMITRLFQLNENRLPSKASMHSDDGVELFEFFLFFFGLPVDVIES